MADSAPKISFGFSKLTKKPNLPPPKPETVKRIDRIQYIDSLENNSFNVINDDGSDKKELLVIPMKNPNTLLDSVKKAVNSRLALDAEQSNGTDPVESLSAQDLKPVEPDSSKIESLDEMAARELMEDSKKQPKEAENNTVIPLNSETVQNVESTLEDYDNVPVSDFGLAMLRGMGWDPAKGVGKAEKVVKVTQPALRPKGMGLGADKVINRQKPVAVNVPADNVLKKGSKVRITVGKYQNTYGTVEAFDDSLGRVSVKMSLSNETVSINECYTQLVTSEEFNKYSKLININTYSRYVENENKSSKSEDTGKERGSSKKQVVESSRKKNISPSHHEIKEPDYRGKYEKKNQESSDSDDSNKHPSKCKEDLSSKHKGKSSELRKGHLHRHRLSSENSSSDSDRDRRKRDKHRKKKSQYEHDSSSDDERTNRSDKNKQKHGKDKSRQKERYKEDDSDSSYSHRKKNKSKKGKRKSRSRSRSVDRRRR